MPKKIVLVNLIGQINNLGTCYKSNLIENRILSCKETSQTLLGHLQTNIFLKNYVRPYIRKWHVQITVVRLKSFCFRNKKKIVRIKNFSSEKTRWNLPIMNLIWSHSHAIHAVLKRCFFHIPKSIEWEPVNRGIGRRHYITTQVY